MNTNDNTTKETTINELALFAGAGGGLLATQHLLGFRTVCYVENAAYPVEVLKARIRDGFLDDAPIWGDVRTFDGNPWRGVVDLVSAGFPCQPWATGGNQHGARDSRNLWPDTIRIIGEVRPGWIFLENSPMLLRVSNTHQLAPYVEQIVGNLATMGYVGSWGCLSAAALGLDHKRQRLWIVAHTGSARRLQLLCLHHENRPQGHAHQTPQAATLVPVWSRLSRLEQRLGEPAVFGTPDGLAHRVDRLTAVGEGQVPIVAATAWRLLTQ